MRKRTLDSRILRQKGPAKPMPVVFRLHPISHEEGRVRFVSRNSTQGIENCFYLTEERWNELGLPEALAIRFEPYLEGKARRAKP